MMMQAQIVRDAQRFEPFRPFVIHLADGRSFRVDHPELVSVLRSGRTIVYENPEGHLQLLDTILVTGLEIVDPPPAPGP